MELGVCCTTYPSSSRTLTLVAPLRHCCGLALMPAKTEGAPKTECENLRKARRKPKETTFRNNEREPADDRIALDFLLWFCFCCCRQVSLNLDFLLLPPWDNRFHIGWTVGATDAPDPSRFQSPLPIHCQTMRVPMPKVVEATAALANFLFKRRMTLSPQAALTTTTTQ